MSGDDSPTAHVERVDRWTVREQLEHLRSVHDFSLKDTPERWTSAELITMHRECAGGHPEEG